MKAVTLDVTVRTGAGRGVVRKLKKDNRIPAVIYGAGDSSVLLSVNRSDLFGVLSHHGQHALLNLAIDGSEQLALIKEVQIDPVRWETLHVDFLRVKEDEEVTTEVPVHFVGDPVGVKEGGVLQQVHSTVTVAALPRELPTELSIDISSLELGANINVSELELPEGVRLVTDANDTLASVTAPAAVEAETTDAEAEGEEGEEGTAEASSEGSAADEASSDDSEES